MGQNRVSPKWLWVKTNGTMEKPDLEILWSIHVGAFQVVLAASQLGKGGVTN